MTLPRADTVVLYPAGATRSTARVLHVETRDDRVIVLVDATPVHPVDAGWPDQGPDAAVLRVAGRELVIVDCVVAATDGESLALGSEIPVRTGTEGWTFVVAHLLDADAASAAGGAPAEGDEVELIVDEEHRRALSLGHTLCHVASLALNQALTGAWRKEVRSDALGRPDFDGVAIERSTIGERSSVDEYRVGKSTRKAGFDPDALADPASLAETVTATVRSWAATDAAVEVARDGDRLTDRRFWVCATPDGEARIPCGGTHATSLAELAGVSVDLETAQLDGAVRLTMTSTV